MITDVMGAEPESDLLCIFGDEAGLAPERDGDEPFVYAAVAVLPPDLPSVATRLNPGALVKRLQKAHALFNSACVCPFPGYESRLAHRVGQLEYHGGITRRSGANVRFLHAEGITRRNWVWGHVVEVAVSEALLRYLCERPNVPRRVKVYLDRKSLTREDSALLEYQMERFGARLRETLLPYRGRVPRGVGARIDEFLNMPPDAASGLRPTLVAKDDCPHGPHGLWLADALATAVRRDLMLPPNCGRIIKRLDQLSSETWLRDLTEQVSRPVSEEVLASWHQRNAR